MATSKRIIILTFSIFLFTGIYSQPEIISILENSDSIGRYDKFELRLHLDAEYENPFDPEDIDITATFTSPSGEEWTVPGFYNYAHWRSLWMVRFSPDETGKWEYRIRVRDRNGETSSEENSFVAIPSAHKGPIRVADNNRYLEYDNGKPYYGVGFWYNDGYNEFNKGRIQPEVLDELKELGVNFISTYITPLETMASGVGRYDQNICGRLDEVFEMCEERGIQVSLNLWFHSYLSETVWGGGNIRWHTNPYQLVTDVKDFFRSEEAWEYQEKLYRYMIARWGYSRSLAIWFIVDEVNGTDGWVTGDSLGAATWGQKVHDYFKANDPWDHLTTGTRSGGITQFWHEGYQIFDLASREIYEAQGFSIIKDGKIDPNGTHPLTHSYRNYAQEVRKLWNGYNKPAKIGETGWDHTFYEPKMPGYLAQYHNAIWVSLTTGAAMTPFWWSYSGFVNDNMVTDQLTSIREFTDEIAFSELTNITPVDIEIATGDAYAMKSDQVVFGWAVNPEVDVADEIITITDLEDGDYTLRIYHTWRGEFIEENEVTVDNGTLEFTVPRPVIVGSHARYIGQDVAFILEPK